jgi:adenosyl cobinamide kinase/adenosyl cobinamide phosphate guanylyltransferase
MKTTSLVLALFLSTTQGVKLYSRIYSGHRNERLQAWDEISKNVNVNELLQSEENALNE